MLASKPQGTLYTGVTNDLMRRVYEHREGLVPGFTRKYGVKMLVWYEEFGDIHDAIAQEKRIKHWQRDWKKNLIERDNPHWTDLYPSFAQRWVPGLAALARMTIGMRCDGGEVVPRKFLRGFPAQAALRPCADAHADGRRCGALQGDLRRALRLSVFRAPSRALSASRRRRSTSCWSSIRCSA